MELFGLGGNLKLLLVPFTIPGWPWTTCRDEAATDPQARAFPGEKQVGKEAEDKKISGIPAVVR